MKNYLKRFALLVKIKRKIWEFLNSVKMFFNCTFGITPINMIRKFPLYTPSSAGSYNQRAQLTILSINQLCPLLSQLAKKHDSTLTVSNIFDFSQNISDVNSSLELKKLFDMYGSDKGNTDTHNYHLLYAYILNRIGNAKSVLEIGLGTNNTDVVSNMSKRGRPGASLKAFRDYLGDAQIYGADVDSRILFQEDKIKTFHVDQTDLESLAALQRKLPLCFDLIIDDGLHAPNANVATLLLFLDKIKVGGWYVIEDIGKDTAPVWEVVSALLADSYDTQIVDTGFALVFIVQRLAFV